MNLTDQLASALKELLVITLSRGEKLGLDDGGPVLDNARTALDSYNAAQKIKPLDNALTIDIGGHVAVVHSNVISDEMCADILCTALEGGIGYWAEAAEIKTTEPPLGTPWAYIRATLYDAEGEDDWKHVVDFAAVRRGIVAALAPEARITGSTKDDINVAIREGDAGMIDASAADAIIQFACFGEIVYG